MLLNNYVNKYSVASESSSCVAPGYLIITLISLSISRDNDCATAQPPMSSYVQVCYCRHVHWSSESVHLLHPQVSVKTCTAKATVPAVGQESDSDNQLGAAEGGRQQRGLGWLCPCLGENVLSAFLVAGECLGWGVGPMAVSSLARVEGMSRRARLQEGMQELPGHKPLPDWEKLLVWKGTGRTGF